MQPLDEFTYHRRLAATPGPALVLLTSPDCGACRAAENRLPQAAPHHALFRVDVQQSPALARALEVFHLPALFLYRDGHYHARLECEITAECLSAAITAALAAPPEEEP